MAPWVTHHCEERWCGGGSLHKRKDHSLYMEKGRSSGEVNILMLESHQITQAFISLVSNRR